jgi:periplasmic protein TonB
MFASPKRSALLSGLLHAGAIVLVLLVTSPRTPLIHITDLSSKGRDVARYIPLISVTTKAGGGGGGMRDPGPARRGVLPRVDRKQYTPPVTKIVNFDPILPMEPTIIGTAVSVLPVSGQIGDPNGVLDSLFSGPGKNGGIGGGEGGGDGPGRGPGAGPGEGEEVGLAGSLRVRGTVTDPVLLWKEEPEYSEEARRARVQGTVVLRIEVNQRGQAQNISVRQSLGLGLDERAIDAVKRWRFRPGAIGGRPVTTIAVVEVNFHLL